NLNSGTDVIQPGGDLIIIGTRPAIIIGGYRQHAAIHIGGLMGANLPVEYERPFCHSGVHSRTNYGTVNKKLLLDLLYAGRSAINIYFRKIGAGTLNYGRC